VKNGARLLVNQTNDAWFDGSWAAGQHMSHAVFRCVENRVPMVRAANTGVSCGIRLSGRFQMLADPDAGHAFAGFAVYDLPVPGEDMPLTWYTRFGDFLLALPCAVATLALLLAEGGSRWPHRRKQVEETVAR
jgi:apolipoprotein N-acyltransferase